VKFIVLIVLFFISSCVTNGQEKVKSLDDPLLIDILALGEVADLNALQKNIEKNLSVKVYKIPSKEENYCFPESHGICMYKYYLATSQIDDSPIVNAYYLGVLGEIVEYKWESTELIDTAIIIISTNKYSKEALSYNKALNNVEVKYRLIAKPNKIEFLKIVDSSEIGH